MIKRTIIVIVLLVVSIFLYGVAKSLQQIPQGKLPPGSTPVGSTNDILDTKWVWVETTLPDGTTITPNQKDAFSITLSSDGNTAGKTDCNSFFSDYALGSDGILSFGPIGSTKMFCEGSQEGIFIDHISKVSHYTFKDGRLVLLLVNAAGSMSFEREHLVTLMIGETKTVGDLSLTLNSFVQDSRCPIDVTCIQAGAVTVNVTMNEGAASETRNFPSDEAPYVFGAHMISISDIAPLRKANQEIAPEEYVIMFKVK